MVSVRSPVPGTVFAADRSSWRDWLSLNHAGLEEAWLLFYKVHTGKKCVPYEDAVQEALCFGWIDGKVRRIDDEKHKIRFTPRRPGSMWSAANVRRATKMIEEGLMTGTGLAEVKKARADGRWQKALDDEKERKREATVPGDLAAALNRVPGARENFQGMAAGYRRDYIRWVESAKREETRNRRIAEVARRAARNLKPGM